jgi:hypothetical protein
MSLESKIEALTQAVIALTAKLESNNVAPAVPVVQAPAPMVAPAATSSAPFSDPKGLIDYVMCAYKALGPQKGALIQGVLTSLGYANINDVKPEHYGQLFGGIEALKV